MIRFILRIISGTFLFMLLYSMSYSQSYQDLANTDLKNVSVDQISDSQLRRFVQEMQSSGMTQQEMEIALKARGMSDTEIEKLKNRIYSIQGETSSAEGLEISRLRDEGQIENMFQGLIATGTGKPEGADRIFGMDLFHSKYLTFEPSLNIPTPKNYQLGPGDEIIIDVWGASEQTYQLAISPDGTIKIPNLGPIYLNGMDIDVASSRIINRLSQIYSGLVAKGGESPNTFAQVSLGQIRSIKVSVIGEVMNPGTYTVSALSTIFNILYLAGGPNVTGSLRQIEVIRNGKIETSFDVYDFLAKGLSGENKRLQDQDIIRVIPYYKRVQIAGEVKRPGIFEIRENEKFSDLINFCGGFSENAYIATIKVRRNTQIEKKIQDFDLNTFLNSSPVNGDYIFIESILTRYSNRVQITGAVFRPGEFELTEGFTVIKIIEKANGLKGDAFLERASIYRTREDLSTEVISFNLRELMKGSTTDILLQREDIIRISSIYDLDEETYITIQGEVRMPGVYPFMTQMTIKDLVYLAGGMRESASEANVEVARRIKNDSIMTNNQLAEIFTFNIDRDLRIVSGQDKAFILYPFDQVFIRKSPAYEIQRQVKVEGEIAFPGSYSIEKKNERISDIIKRAGNLTPDAYIRGATLIRRTEFYPPNSHYEQKLIDLRKLRNTVDNLSSKREVGESNESEMARDARLSDLDREAFQFKDNESLETGQEGIRIRQQRLAQLARKDTLADISTSLRFESIGIELEDILLNPGSKYDLILQDGDILSIPRQLETVRLRGEFLYPTSIRFDSKLNFRDYISQAGGFTTSAKKNKAYIIYANGAVRSTNNFLFIKSYPRVEPGSDIIVPNKPDREPLSAQAWIALTTSIATLAVLIQSLVQ